MEEKNALVRNAADEKQVKTAKRKERHREEDADNDMRRLLDTDFGRRFLWRYMTELKVFGSVWDPTVRIHFNEGRRDVGRQMMAEIIKANPAALVEMMAQGKKDDEKA